MQDASVTSFADYSKLLATKASLVWHRADLYALLYQCLGNAPVSHKHFASWVGRSRATTTNGGSNWAVPSDLRLDEDRQEALFERLAGKAPRRAPGLGDFAIAAQDAVIAAQNAVVAAEALGLGSCYIGDIVENAEEVAELLDLPPYTMPLSMLIIGTPRKERPAIAHPVVNLVHEERYCRADAATMDAQVAEMDAMFRPHAREVGERVVDIYTRKHTSPFMAEMSRSMEWWFKNWLRK